MTDLDQPATHLPQANRAAEFLANQRTFLAWIRTSIAVISFGFVTGKLSVMLPFLAGHNDPTAPTNAVHKFPVGLGMIAFGGLLAILAAWRYRVVNSAIEKGAVRAERGAVVFVALLVVLLAILMITYMVTKPEMM
jgi:putative membrane protein